MGNCLFGGLGETGVAVIRVMNSNGGIMEFYPPINVEAITAEFPGHAIYPNNDIFWNPLSGQDELLPGNTYHLLPLTMDAKCGASAIVRTGHVRSNSVCSSAPYRMSFDNNNSSNNNNNTQKWGLKRSYTEAFCKYGGAKAGFWKVKLVISSEQLMEILSEQCSTEELIESVRTVAKCGINNSGNNNNNGDSLVGAGAFSDQWSLSSSRNASSKHDGSLL